MVKRPGSLSVAVDADNGRVLPVAFIGRFPALEER